MRVIARHCGTAAGCEVFRCSGLASDTLRLRRRVQAAVALDLLAAPYAKVLGHPMDATNFLTVSEQLMSNSNFVLALHAGAIWFYHCFLRDHLTARHVTRIYLDRPWSEIPEALDSKRTIVATVETGPWQMRMELSACKGSPHAVSLRQLFSTGALHLDRDLGDVTNKEALDLLCARDLFPISEDISVDGSAKTAAFIGLQQPSALVAEDSEGTLNWLEALPPALKKPLQWPGRAFCTYFGLLCLAMGITSVLVWLPPSAWSIR